MKLASKIALILVVFGLLLIVDDYLLMRREIRILDEDLKRDAILFRQRIEPSIMKSWKLGGDAAVVEFLEELNEAVDATKYKQFEFTSIRWIVLDPDSESVHQPMAAPSELTAESFEGDFKTIRHSTQDQDYMLVYTKLSVGADRVLELAEPTFHQAEINRHFVRRVLIFTFLTLLLGAGVVIYLGRELIGRPLKKLIDKTRRIGEGDLSGPVEIRRRDEFGELAASINSMCDQLSDAQKQLETETQARIEAMEQLRHADRLRTVGRLASGIAHEIGTPLNVVSGRAEMILSGHSSEDEVKKNARIIKSESDRIASIIRGVLDFARPAATNREPVDLVKLVAEVAEVMRPLAEQKGVEIQSSTGLAPLMANVDRGQMHQALINLIVNGVQAMPEGGHLKMGVQHSSQSPPPSENVNAGDFACIVIEDHGQGISEEDLNSIFEPFFTTKDVGEGTGLGLSIVHGIVKEHGGWIGVDSQVGQGTRFEIFLPLEVPK